MGREGGTGTSVSCRSVCKEKSWKIILGHIIDGDFELTKVWQ